ncbi:hypothetical protein [Kosakonia sp. Marseille-Q7440]
MRKKRDGAQTQVKILHFASAYRSGWWCNGGGNCEKDPRRILRIVSR